MDENSLAMGSEAVPAWPGLGKPTFPPLFISPQRLKKTGYLPLFIQKMMDEKIGPDVIEAFRHYYAKVRDGADGMIADGELDRIDPDDLLQADQFTGFAQAGKKALNKTAVIVLNGGLGTTMGLNGAKSLIPVKGADSFLEITLNQALRQGVGLCFMNSFSTHNATRHFIAAHRFSHPVAHFVQNKFPKILKGSLAPATWWQNPNLEWNPPGHGDIYTAMYASGTLARLLEAGIRYAFVSNSDNLGGSLDESLLGYFVESGIPFMMEVLRRSPSDIKGGHIAKRKDGRLVLREISQCPRKDLRNFQNIDHHCFFNTNNIWIDLAALNEKIRRDNVVRLPMILNAKTLDPKDAASPPVYQIESAMGSAVSLFEGAGVVAVGRDRFFPVKTCSDLLILRSDRVLLTRDYKLVPNPENHRDGIEVHLDPKYYRKIDRFEQRFPFGPPSLARCNALRIEGDVRFEGNIALRGNVTIRNQRNNQVSIEAGSIIEGDRIFK